MSEGWIKLHRKLTDNFLWQCEKFTRGQAWIDLLLLANHKKSFFYLRDHKINIDRGQVGYSQLKLSERWKWSRSKVKKFLKDLEKEQQIKQQITQSTTIITIIKYNDYQEKEQQDKQQKDNRKTTEEQQKDTNKNDKKDNNDKNEKKKKRFTPPLLDEWIKYFEENGYKKNVAERSFRAYEVADWFDSTGKKVKNWKQKAINVWFKDEHKIVKTADEWDERVKGAKDRLKKKGLL